MTNDPVYIQKQNIVAKKLNDLDSGQNIRKPEGYKALFNLEGYQLGSEVLSGLLNVPYKPFLQYLAPKANLITVSLSE